MAVRRFQEFEPLTQGQGYYVAFSGGKDSSVILALAKLSGVKFDAHHNLTTIDPPELVRFVVDRHPEVVIDRPERSMLKKLETKGMPTRMGRWCCEYLKERSGSGRFVVTGVRWAESRRRAQRRMVESCYKDTGKRYLHPIIEWTDEDVWKFIREQNVPYCGLYDEGFKRLGCLFCPIAGRKQKARERLLYPRYEKLFVRAFQRLKENREAAGKHSCDRWKDGQEMFDWWVSNKSVKDFDQEKMFSHPVFE